MDQCENGTGPESGADKLEPKRVVQPLQSSHRTHYSSNRTARKHYRQLWWMLVMLVLVCWLMQKASNPQLYERFFKAIGVPLVPAKGSTANE